MNEGKAHRDDGELDVTQELEVHDGRRVIVAVAYVCMQGLVQGRPRSRLTG